MRSAVIVFPGSNCDRDAHDALARLTGRAPEMVWYAETALPNVDAVIVPGGFSYGDYLRVGAMAARAPIMAAVAAAANRGVPTLGICNGFQILCEAGLLPGALMRNTALTFAARDVHLKVERTDTPFTRGYADGAVIRVPIAHHDGNYFTDDDTLARLEGEGHVVVRYVDGDGRRDRSANPNGSRADIAGICNSARNVVGLMPHPERAVDTLTGGADGAPMFAWLAMELAPDPA